MHKYIYSYEQSNIQNKLKQIKSDLTNYEISRIIISMPFHISKSKILNNLKSDLNQKPFFINRKCEFPIKINYTDNLGSDRLCSSVGAYTKYSKRKNLLIVDFGTATTYNFISNGIYSGGIISAGIGTSLKSLSANTKLSGSGLKFPKEIFNVDTSGNINSGILYSALFAYEGIVKFLKKRYKSLYIIVTGGYSDFITEKSKLYNIQDKDLIFEGMDYIYNFNIK